MKQKGQIMTISPQQRQLFIKDIEDAFEALYLNISHLDNQTSLAEIITILHSLRIAANTFGEYKLQKGVEEVLALMLNHQNEHNKQIVSKLYALLEVMVYPFQQENMITA